MAYGALAGVIMPIALVGLVGAGMWGYQEHNEKNSILIKAENQYQRAFHDLNFHINKLHEELAKTLVVNSRKQTTPSLTNVWRIAYTAQSDVGQLPLTLMPFNNTEEFLSKVADFSYGVAVRDLNQQPLTDKEHKTLEGLYKHSKQIREQLLKVQTQVIDKRLRWMDVETALAGDDKRSDNTIIDGFKTIDKNVQSYNDIDWGTNIKAQESRRKMRIKGIDGHRISPEEARRTALSFVGLDPNSTKVEVDENGKAEQYPSYSVRMLNNRLTSPINLEVTKRSGKVAWLLNERQIGKPKLSVEQAEESARKFLRAHGYNNMVAAERDRYGGLAVFSFVPEENGVRIYPDAVTVKVAMDTGEVNGFHSVEYLFNHKQRNLPKATITQQKARTMINPNVKVTEQRLALIEGKSDGKEVMCHEFTGDFQGNVFKIYINAANGDEEEVVRMDTGEM